MTGLVTTRAIRRYTDDDIPVQLPSHASVAATITLGRPQGAHGPVRRRPMKELVFEDSWGNPALWANDPPGTQFTQAGPPRAADS